MITGREVAVTHSAPRCEMLLSALVSALSITLTETATASPLNPEQTIVRLPGQLQSRTPLFPSRASTTACSPATRTSQGSTTRLCAGGLAS